MDKSAKFWDRIARRYSKQSVANEAAYQKKLEVTRQYLRPDMVVFEFGCGTGSTAIAHAPYVKEIHAIDISSKMIEIAQEKADLNKIENVIFKQASIDEAGIPDQSIDVVMGHSILHLLNDHSEAISDAYRMLKSGGVFVTSTVCAGDSFTFRLMAYFVSVGALFGLLPRLGVFTSKQLVASFTHAGFEIDYQWQPGKDSAVFIVAKKP